MKNGKSMPVIFTILTTIFLSACAATNNEEGNTDNQPGIEENTEHEEMDKGESDNNEEIDHSGMSHSGSGEVPEDIQEAENPTYPVGSEAVIETDHMPGMKGAEATIVGAYDATVYAVTYMPTTGGEPVENHKWVIHGEIENAGEEPFESGAAVTLLASHMEGMEGATAVIVSAEDTTLHMVNYVDTDTGEEVQNHEWVTESELSPVE